MWKRVIIHKRPRLRKPVLIVSISTTLPQYRALYSQARELANYLIKKSKFEEMVTLHSSALPAAVVISQEGTSRLVRDQFYYHAGKRDIVLLAGDGSPMDEQYEFASAVLDVAKTLGIHEVYSIGARWAESPTPPTETPKVLGFATDAVGVEELRRNGVEIVKEEAAPFFANLIVGLAGLEGMRGYKISVNHGEPLPHPKSLIQIIGVLSRMVHLEVDRSELEGLAVKESSTAQPSITGSEEKGEGQGIYH